MLTSKHFFFSLVTHQVWQSGAGMAWGQVLLIQCTEYILLCNIESLLAIAGSLTESRLVPAKLEVSHYTNGDQKVVGTLCLNYCHR